MVLIPLEQFQLLEQLLLLNWYNYWNNFCLMNLSPCQQNFFPEQMVAWCQDSNGTIPPSQLLQVCKDVQLHLPYHVLS